MHVHWLFMTISTILTFALLLVLVRWIGSTQLTQLTFFNWVAGASMGNIAANMIDADNTSDFFANSYALIVFTASTIVAAFVALKSRRFRRVTNGEPIVLIHKGDILRENLRKTKINVDVLMMMLREKGYFAYSDIEFGILEPTGNLSILPTPESQSASKLDLAQGPDLSDKGQGPYVELIVDGELDRDKLSSAHRDEVWVAARAKSYGAKGIEDVLYFAVNKEGEVIVDLKKDKEQGDINLLN